MKIRILLILGFCWLAGCLLVGAQEFQYAEGTVVTPSGVKIPVELADTPAKRSLGLGKRDGLKDGAGMLFVFENKQKHAFWMKNMRFAIDIIWMNNHRIVHIERNVPPPDPGQTPVTLSPAKRANFVLEIEAGYADQLGLAVDQQLKYQW